MNTYVALLRAVNLGPTNRIAMGDLRAMFTALGHEDVTTYVQSGNIVFRSRKARADALARDIKARIRQDTGLDLTVMVRTADQLARLLKANPFLARGVDPARLHVAFLDAEPDRQGLRQLGDESTGRDEFVARGRDVFLHYPAGVGRAKLSNAFLEKRLAVAATTRNWNTVTRLVELAEDLR